MIVYKVTDLRNGRVYVGQTTGALEARKSYHYRRARYDRKKGRRMSALAKVLLAAPVECFVWEVIDRAETQDALNWLEARYILRFDSLVDRRGYNHRLGGNNGRHSAFTRARQREVKLGVRHTPEVCARMSVYQSTRPRDSKLDAGAILDIVENPDDLSNAALARRHSVDASYVWLIRNKGNVPQCRKDCF